MGCLAGFLGVLPIFAGLGHYFFGKMYGASFFNWLTIVAIILGLFEFYLVKVIDNGQKWGKVAVFVSILPTVYIIVSSIFGLLY